MRRKQADLMNMHRERNEISKKLNVLVQRYNYIQKNNKGRGHWPTFGPYSSCYVVWHRNIVLINVIIRDFLPNCYNYQVRLGKYEDGLRSQLIRHQTCNTGKRSSWPRKSSTSKKAMRGNYYSVRSSIMQTSRSVHSLGRPLLF